MKKYYKTNVSIFNKQSDCIYEEIVEEKDEIIIEEISKNRKYREFVTGYPIKAVYLYPVTTKEIMHDAILNIGNPEEFVNDEINEKGFAILFSLSSLNKDNMSNHIQKVHSYSELSSYIEKFPNSKFYRAYKNLIDCNKIKVKK